jgi:hypothetical protein
MSTLSTEVPADGHIKYDDLENGRDAGGQSSERIQIRLLAHIRIELFKWRARESPSIDPGRINHKAAAMSPTGASRNMQAVRSSQIVTTSPHNLKKHNARA